MRSTVRDCDLEVKDWDVFLEWVKDIIIPNKDAEERGCYPDWYKKKCLIIDEKTKTVDFNCGEDGLKVVSYWYRDLLQFLKELAYFVDGIIHFEFENDDESGYVEFKNNKAIISCGVMDWNTYENPEDLIVGKDEDKLKPLSEKYVNKLIVGKI